MITNWLPLDRYPTATELLLRKSSLHRPEIMSTDEIQLKSEIYTPDLPNQGGYPMLSRLFGVVKFSGGLLS